MITLVCKRPLSNIRTQCKAADIDRSKYYSMNRKSDIATYLDQMPRNMVNIPNANTVYVYGSILFIYCYWIYLIVKTSHHTFFVRYILTLYIQYTEGPPNSLVNSKCELFSHNSYIIITIKFNHCVFYIRSMRFVDSTNDNGDQTHTNYY